MQTIAANNIATAVAISGHGAPVLLLHGGEADHTMFADLAPLLAEHLTVIAPDQRDSGSTRNPTASYTFVDLADDVAALITALGYQRADVFGTSFGGVIAQVLAARHPERVERLVLSSTFRAGMTLPQVNPPAAAALMALRAELPASALRIAGYFFPSAYLQAHPEVSRMFAGSKRTPEQQARRAAIFGHPLEVDLGAIRAPTLVLAGADDQLIPPHHSLSLATDIPGAKPVLLDGVAHVGTIHAPRTVAHAVIEFLST